MATRVRSYSKINLGLAVGPARADGFHGLTTVYQTLALHDFVTVSARLAATTEIRVTSNHPGVPSTAHDNAEKNTAWKIVAKALDRLELAAEVDIDIEKRLPVQGGMGAGSANGAAALLGLERELGMALPGADRLRLAAEVGSDVPLFLLGGTVLGLDRGEDVFPLPEADAGLHCVLAVPNIGVSTAFAFKELDQRAFGDGLDDRSDFALTFQQAGDRLKELSYAIAAIWTPTGNPEVLQTGAEAGPSGITRPRQVKGIQGDLAENPLLALVRTGIENDFEEVVFSQHPSLRSTKRDLLGTSVATGESKALYAALSGSGSALFGLYASHAAAEAAQQRVQANGTRAILTETLPRRRYWETMFA
jgi:4-diphosphocytidyl-2-C-methyl-D-erythritol kinase